MATLEIDSIIERLLAVRGPQSHRTVNLTEGEIRALCAAARDIFLSQPCLLELEAPLKICGDVHGQYSDLLRLFEYGGFPPDANYLFLGDYVDRGKQGLEVICLLLAYKVKYPENFFMLRGNHECSSISRIYGFYDECKRRYNIKLWRVFCDVFNCLPFAAIVDEKVFCIHGGPSPELKDMQQIMAIKRPTDIPDVGMLCDFLWSDPDADVSGWGENDRGVSYTYGTDVVADFLQRFDFDLIVRAHQVVENGYEFFGKRQLVTVFSAPNYCLSEEMQILTSKGWCFLDQFAEAWRSSESTLLVAGYDHSSGGIIYERPSPKMIVNAAKPQQLVEIAGRLPDGRSWWDASDSYGHSDSGSALHFNGLCLSVTPDHQMFAKIGRCNGSSGVLGESGTNNYFKSTTAAGLDGKRRATQKDYAKMPASSLVSADARDILRVPCIAPAGCLSVSNDLPFITKLGLTTEVQIIAFLEMYGWWLGDGSLEFGDNNKIARDAVLLSPVKKKDATEITRWLDTLGLELGTDFYYNAPTTTTPQHRWGITKLSYCDLFRSQYQHKYARYAVASREVAAETETQPSENIKSAKWMWYWVWRLNRQRMRALLTGLILADGTISTNCVNTSSVRFREEIVRAGLHAGYSCKVESVYLAGANRGQAGGSTDIIANYDSWRVYFSTDSGAAEPILSQSDVRLVPYNGRTWCVTMPHGFIWTRRASCDENGVVIKMSRPTIVGNCGEFDNAGAMMTVDENLMCSFQILKPAEKKTVTGFGGLAGGRPSTPPRGKVAGK